MSVVQKGKQFKIGFGALEFVGYQIKGDGCTHAREDTTEEIRGEQDEVVTWISTNPTETLVLDSMIETDGTIDPFSPNDFVAVTAPNAVAAVNWRVKSAPIVHGPKITTVVFTLDRPDSMQAVLDA
ncbi:MAG: hypothetical protein B6244_14340 [Candidatus Cloacimonetes bacterium 4572_55]|nr:MAG: hypothetical protein B6244_14340 [Candidatus Cloacimonetes bacterium 4572_55]